MAFLRTANAIVVKPQTSQQGWSKVRTAANLSPEIPSQNLIAQASEILGTPFDPKRYLLSHVTIVASVDVESGPNIKLGSIVENGQKINRKYLDYRIKASSDPLINSNLDAFGRAVLLKSYKTFVGGENFCFVAGTPVLMADGTYKPIESVRVGEKVVSHTGKIRQVVHCFEREYSGNVLDISVNGGTHPISVTPNHPFPVVSNKYCACGCGSPLVQKKGNTRVGVLRRRTVAGHNMRVAQYVDTHRHAAETLNVGDLLMCPTNINWGGDTNFEVHVARLVGYFLSEGCYSGLTATRYVFHVEEKSFIQEVVDCARCIDPECTISISASESTDQAVEVRVNSVKVNALMRTFVAGEYAHTKTIRVDKITQSRDFVLSLIGACVNGDGTRGSRLRLTSTSKDMLDQIKVLGSTYGVHGSVLVRTNQPVGSSVTVRMPNGKLTTVVTQHQPYDLWYDYGSSIVLEPYTNKGVDVRVRHTAYKYQSDHELFSITKIQPREFVGRVYNIEVEKDHSYIAGGIATFNCEHVQIPELSKGKILDAVPREVGDSIYIDILVATDRKHTQLVEDIISGKMSTLSMGASVSFTICTQCGNVAVDETEFCSHIKYSKGNVFLNDRGERCRVAELCGHADEPDGGVHFIEASWVATPAFTGAVLRNILNATDVSVATLKQAQHILSQPPKEWVADKPQKHASLQVQAGEDEGADPYADEGGESNESGDEPAEPEAPAAPEKSSPLDTLEDDVLSGIVDRVHKMVITDLDKKIPKSDVSTNDTLNKQAQVHKQATDKAASLIKSAYRTGLQTILRTASCDADIIDRIASLDRAAGIQTPTKIYRVALQIGAISQYSSEDEYHTMCLAHFSPDSPPSPADIRTLVRLGKILTRSDKR